MDSACKYISYLKTMEKHIEGTPFAGMFYTAEAFYELKANRDFSKGISLLIKSYNEFENYNDIENMVIRIPQRQRFTRSGAGAVVRFSAAPSSRCSKAALRSGRIPQRQHFPRFGAGAADGSWGGDRVSCAAILQRPAYHQNSSRLLSRIYVLATCRTRHISLPNGHSAPYLHKSSRRLFPERLIIRHFYKHALLDTRYTSRIKSDSLEISRTFPIVSVILQ